MIPLRPFIFNIYCRADYIVTAVDYSGLTPFSCHSLSGGESPDFLKVRGEA